MKIDTNEIGLPCSRCVFRDEGPTACDVIRLRAAFKELIYVILPKRIGPYHLHSNHIPWYYCHLFERRGEDENTRRD